jgi:hypothetical protein
MIVSELEPPSGFPMFEWKNKLIFHPIFRNPQENLSFQIMVYNLK